MITLDEAQQDSNSGGYSGIEVKGSDIKDMS